MILAYGCDPSTFGFDQGSFVTEIYWFISLSKYFIWDCVRSLIKGLQMVDLSDKGSESEAMSSQTPTPDRCSSDSANVKTCVDCGTSKTPLWRGGPAGPKSLCNACGIRSRKKRRALMGVTKEEKKTKKSSTNAKIFSHQSTSSNSCTSSSGDSTSKIRVSLNKKLWAFGLDVALQRPRSNTPQRRKLGEEEQAAFLLMALSCGSVYA